MNDDLQKYRKVIMESQEPIANFSFTVGRMYVAMVRNFLEEVTFNHPEIIFLEGQGIFQKEFKVRGPSKLLKVLYEYMKKTVKEA